MFQPQLARFSSRTAKSIGTLVVSSLRTDMFVSEIKGVFRIAKHSTLKCSINCMLRASLKLSIIASTRFFRLKKSTT